MQFRVTGGLWRGFFGLCFFFFFFYVGGTKKRAPGLFPCLTSLANYKGCPHKGGWAGRALRTKCGLATPTISRGGPFMHLWGHPNSKIGCTGRSGGGSTVSFPFSYKNQRGGAPISSLRVPRGEGEAPN